MCGALAINVNHEALVQAPHAAEPTRAGCCLADYRHHNRGPRRPASMKLAASYDLP
jgi:hypothetical protein